MHHGNGADRPVIRQNRPVSIQDPASGRLDGALPLMQILGLLTVIGRFSQHQPSQPHRQQCQRRRADKKNQGGLFSVKYLQLS